jgi:hypothetical protein
MDTSTPPMFAVPREEKLPERMGLFMSMPPFVK